MTTPRNVLTVWSRLFAASLASAGVRDVVVSPGSRSTPFVLALRERPELRLTSAIDERSAAFLALGMGRATGRAAAVIATSGTAPAHWFPAVIEASLSHVPLVLLSANRPLSLAHAGAPQTIDQTKLFGSWVRYFGDAGDPRSEASALEGLARMIGQAVAAAHGPDAGPAHLDLHADKPLEPVEPRDDAERALAELGSAITGRVTRITGPEAGVDEIFAETLREALARARRPLVVAGPRRVTADARAILSSCARARVPVAAEATSQLRFVEERAASLDATEMMFACERFADEHCPDLVVQLGSFPTAPTLEHIGRRAPRFVLDAGGAHDPTGTAIAISLGRAAPTLARALDGAERGARDDVWLASLQRAEATAWSQIERALSHTRCEGAVVRAAVASAPRATLMIGNSMPIRTLDRFVRGGGATRRVLAQRGANGIDGLVSGAIGAAIAGDVPVLAIVGDVSFLHDVNALTTARALHRTLVVVVVDNGGGRIFDALPIAHDPALGDAMPLFTTPHGVDLAGATRAFGVACVETHDAVETNRAVIEAISAPRITVVRAIVERDDDVAFPALVRAFEHAFYGGPP